MSRVLDRLLVTKECFPRARNLLCQAEVILCDNVANYIWKTAGKTHWDIDKDFPSLAPPFEITWMEYCLPRGIEDKYRIASSEVGARWPVHHGAIVLAIDFQHLDDLRQRGIRLKEKAQEAARRARLYQKMGLCSEEEAQEADDFLESLDEKTYTKDRRFSLTRDMLPTELWDIAKESRWVLFVRGLVEKQKGVFRQGANLTLLVRSDGSIAGYKHRAKKPEDVDDPAWLRDQDALLPFLMTFCLLQCRNVELVERNPDAVLSRAHKKKRGLPLVKYKILEIEPMRKVFTTEGDVEKTGLKQALHICRGHFKDYRQRGLFRQHKGIYWWDQMLRGSKDEGIVLKDYAVKAPNTQQGEVTDAKEA